MKQAKELLSFSGLSIGFVSGRHTKVVYSSLNGNALKGDVIALAGTNGIGKSTLLRTLVNIQPPLSGNISLSGIDYRSYTRNQIARKAGFVSAATPPAANLAVYELVSLGRFPFTNWIGRMSTADRKAVDDAIYSVGLTDHKNSLLGELSDGERQRAMIARVLAQDSELLVMDEPTAFLDMPGKYELINLMRKLVREKGKSVIFSTHDLQLAVREADMLWLMTSAGLRAGCPEDLILRGVFENIFPGSALKFNEDEAVFSYSSGELYSVRLSGSGRERSVTHKALSRINIGIGEDTSLPLLEIDHDDDGIVWRFSNNGPERLFRSVYALTRFMREMK